MSHPKVASIHYHQRHTDPEVVEMYMKTITGPKIVIGNMDILSNVVVGQDDVTWAGSFDDLMTEIHHLADSTPLLNGVFFIDITSPTMMAQLACEINAAIFASYHVRFY